MAETIRIALPYTLLGHNNEWRQDAGIGARLDGEDEEALSIGEERMI